MIIRDKKTYKILSQLQLPGKNIAILWSTVKLHPKNHETFLFLFHKTDYLVDDRHICPVYSFSDEAEWIKTRYEWVTVFTE